MYLGTRLESSILFNSVLTGSLIILIDSFSDRLKTSIPEAFQYFIRLNALMIESLVITILSSFSYPFFRKYTSLDEPICINCWVCLFLFFVFDIFIKFPFPYWAIFHTTITHQVFVLILYFNLHFIEWSFISWIIFDGQRILTLFDISLKWGNYEK